jgi:hypothetical protein
MRDRCPSGRAQIIGLVVLGCIVASLAVLAGLIEWLGAPTGIVVGFLIATGGIGTCGRGGRSLAAPPGGDRPRGHHPMPRDALLGETLTSMTRVITIDVWPEAVFPWLRQIGYGRGGWYSYDWIDNDGKPSVEWIDPALQPLAVGDRI